MEVMQKLLREDAAAQMLGLSKRTLQSWRVRGGGPVFQKVGKKAVRYAAEDLADFARRGRHDSTSSY